ncbi:MAG TPA: SIMPL domain-containing protein, partial [Gemmatimonadaceae bacterium]|nr:SIMPL domain-containing protein [Gemmatimonadaceae bacterium]
MRTCVVSLTSTLFVASTLWAQVPTPTRSISVSGSAEVRVTPSLVNLVVGVETLNRSLAAAKAENDRRVQAVVQSMRTLGVAPKDIQTDYIQVHPEYVTRNDTVTILRHYTVRKTIAVTLNDVTRFERALSGALESGANHILNVQFLTSDLRKHRDDARARAIQAAREKAEALAREMNARVGRVISIHEGGWG